MIHRDKLDGMSFADIAIGLKLPPLKPGDVLLEEFMRPMGLTARALAAELGVPANRIASIVNGSRTISAETAILVGRRFGTSSKMWMNLQTSHHVAVAKQWLAGKAA